VHDPAELLRAVGNAVGKSLLVLSFGLPLSTLGQVNSWTKPSSGYWEEPYWSLGVLPTNGQDVAIDNEGWKAVAIGPTTTQNFPESLTLHSLAVASPSNSYNVLLMNYAGLQTPLRTRFLTVASNSAMTMLYSALCLNGGTGDGMSIGGEFNQSESSVVAGQQMDVGYIGPGVYNLNSGTLTLTQMWIGGPYHGSFNQYGGTNRIGLLHLDYGGSYNFYGGEFATTNIYFTGGTFFQRGGVLRPIYHWGEPWNYVLLDGINDAGFGYGIGVQLGGTNLGPLGLGNQGYGGYTLSNGVSMAELGIGGHGYFTEWAGSQTATGIVYVRWDYAGRGGGIVTGALQINGGMFSAGGLSIGGYYAQNGGTNIVRGLTILDAYGSVSLNGGLLMGNDVTVNANYSTFNHYGGIHVVTNQFTIVGQCSPYSNYRGYKLYGGQLIVSNVTVSSGASFYVSDRALAHSGNFTCAGGVIFCGPGNHQFGLLWLSVSEICTNSILSLPWNTNSVVNFRSSSSVSWMNTATLTISNWSGSISGGGTHQIIFGDSAAALTPQQLSQIYFQDPVGQPPGLYSAKILSNGEIVPNVLTPTGPCATNGSYLSRSGRRDAHNCAWRKRL
jgi:hypothetical protein